MDLRLVSRLLEYEMEAYGEYSARINYVLYILFVVPL